MRSVLLVVALSGCGGPSQPVLANAPRPNPAVVAGAAAAVAGAATLANPAAAQRNAAEANKPLDDDKPQKSGGVVPAAVFDRLDKKQNTHPPGATPPSPGGEP